ncbi:MAG: hypothetical protein AAF491_03200 [Verrucomicrobiota bacterium]
MKEPLHPSDHSVTNRTTRLSLLELLRRYWVALLLLGVASHQFYRVHAEGLSSWRGGGFGMYGGYHPRQNDLWWTDLETGQSTRYTKKKGKATEDERYPSLRPFLTYVNGPALNHYFSQLPERVQETTRIEVWRPDFDPATGVLTRHLLISAGPAEGSSKLKEKEPVQ